MTHTPVPAGELRERLSRLRAALAQQDPDWSMLLLENKVDLYYFTGTMQDGVLAVTPDCAVLFVRRSYETAVRESAFSDIRPMQSFRALREAFPAFPARVHLAARSMTLQKLALLQKHLPITHTEPADAVLGALRAVKSPYELACLREAGAVHRRALEETAPALLRRGVSEARLCGEVCTALLEHGAMGISRFNQPAADDVLGVVSFGENALAATGLDSPTGTVGTSLAMKSIGSASRRLADDELVLLDIPGGAHGYHTDKSICFFYGSLARHPQGDLIRAAREQCIRLEQEAAALLRPGAVPSEIYETLCARVDPAFRAGFMSGRRFIGHSLGLTVDETPVLARGFTQPLEAGMVFAVEPKIALPGIGLVGSENTYEIVPDGHARSLTGACDTIFEING